MYKKILNISKNLKSKFYFDFDIYKMTWFQAGGKSDVFCVVYDEDELKTILNNAEGIPHYIIGAGSNILIRDGGYKGLIIKLGKSFNNLSIINEKILVGASILDVNFSKFAYNNSISNFEFYSGIPGTIGGAVKMNAGCFGNETKDFLNKVNIITKDMKTKTIYKKDLNLTYRNSNLLDEIVTSAEFNIEYGEKKKILEKINEIKNTRNTTQPIKNKTSGSTFKNPKGFHAAKLIEDAGCKGMQFGDAIVSQQHANFIINTNNASAEEIENLGKEIIEKVYNKFQIILEWEIKIIGKGI